MSISKSKPLRANLSHFMGAVLLASGTCIGAGMLALPILTGMAGFIPTTLIYILSWLVMGYTSLLLLEVNLWLPDEVNFISMAEITLGKIGKQIAFMTYIFLFYSVSVAYLSGAGSILLDVISATFGVDLPRSAGILIALSLFGPVIYFGTKAVANLNSILMIGIVAGYALLLCSGHHLVDASRLIRSNWSYMMMGIPVIVTSFTFQNVLPSLTSYLKRDVSQLKKVIFLGGFFPLVIYFLWEWFVLGVIPVKGPISLQSALLNGEPATHPLKELLHNPSITTFSQIFAFSAIVTSFLGVILSLFDFLADSFKIKKEGKGKLFLCATIFLPPLLLALSYPRAFLTALNYAGGVGCVTLFIILPPLMVLKGRQKGLKGEYKAPGGVGALYATLMLGFMIFALQIALTLGLLKTV